MSTHTSHGKHFTLFSFTGTPPDGWKIAIALQELGLEYHIAFLDNSKGESRSPEHTKYNPNGRIPTLIDHKNDDFVVWESNAILTYMVEMYDKQRRISFESFEHKIEQLQWLLFQASGQGPYFGQAALFQFAFPEHHPDVIDRYLKETVRVFGVLESVLSKKTWLVGDKYSIVDLSFMPWNDLATSIMLKDYNGFDFERDFPAVAKWHKQVMDRASVQKVWAVRAGTMPQIPPARSVTKPSVIV